jgi:hypothetical protein
MEVGVAKASPPQYSTIMDATLLLLIADFPPLPNVGTAPVWHQIPSRHLFRPGLALK